MAAVKLITKITKNVTSFFIIFVVFIIYLIFNSNFIYLYSAFMRQRTLSA